MLKKVLCFSALFCYALFSKKASAQNHQYQFWGGWFNNVKLSDKWGINNDFQFRTNKEYKDVSALILRGGANYYLNSSNTLAAGYAAVINTADIRSHQSRLQENRIWQQWIKNNKIAGVPVMHRLRLEQRFVNRNQETLFSQRARYFFRTVIPLGASYKSGFSSGFFVSAQNEAFVNVHNQKNVNNRFFDQNRAYASFGYRISPKTDIEIGYMNQYISTIAAAPNIMNHISQIAFYSRL